MRFTPIPIVPAATRHPGGVWDRVPDPAASRRAERVIAVARLFSAVAVVETAIAQVDLFRFRGLPLALVLSYAAISLLALIVLAWRGAMPPRLPILMQCVDIGVAAMVPWSHTGGALTLLLVFPLLAAAYRHRFRHVLMTAGAIDALIAAPWAIAQASARLELGAALEAFDVSALIASTTFVVIVGVVVGYFAENEHQRRSESDALSYVVAQAKPGAEFNGMLDAVLSAIRDVFAARTTLLVLQDVKTTRLFRWEVGTLSTNEPPAAKELPAAGRGDYLFAAPGDAWHAVARRLSRRGAFDAVAIDAEGRRLEATDFVPPAGFMAAHPCQRVLGVSLTFEKTWTGWLFVIDPALGLRREVITRFAQRLVSHTSRVIYGYYLVHSVRTRAQAAERSRIARELHDGITQSLLGLEMEIVALQRRAIAEAPQISADLARVQKLLRREVITMRETMEGIRAGNNASGNIVEELAEMVDRFRRYTGIYASFVSAQPVISMSGHMRRQIALILHEALVNLRKHTRASRVLVRTETTDGRFQLSIEDDGGGFPFAGLRTLPELDALRQGPRIIGERVRMIGGEMTVESRPGLGASIVISFMSGPAHE